MLGKLVNKFKKQTLQEGTEDTASEAPQQLRKSARLNRSPDNSNGSPREDQRHGGKSLSDDDDEPLFFDSGTESDDEELEQLDSASNASMGGGTAMRCGGNFSFNGSSPPTLTSSPPLISEIDTNSLHSMGCESGIVLRESAERDDFSMRSIDLLEKYPGSGTPSKEREIPVPASDQKSPSVTPPAQLSSLPVDFSALRRDESASDEGTTPPSGNADSIVGGPRRTRKNSSSARKDSVVMEKQGGGGAFRPVLRRRTRRNSQQNGSGIGTEFGQNGSQEMRQPVRGVTPTNLIGEKRRRQVSQMDADKTDSDALNDSETEQSPIASRTRSTLTIGGEAELPISADLPRSVLTARRTRVRVLYHDPSPQHGAIPLHMRSGMPVQFGGEGSAGPVALGESPPNNPLRKRGRHSDRPSLNFDKMRERMMSGYSS
ncbi:hypothetical protein AAVH_13959 [Aphelenchoides avenae]|nr:hypothetical protein AAVH_13959 [Aphelenchus avenae]